ncbi:glycoside hydrolase domain-containing protein [Proteiniphilum sp.]|uniref:glycoside hydrolase domain-containing protein n=1 Tax=Proteiniphilum sp. TaxID=1926877 RepID=UPI002B204379|nr:glycoside hydrolase domain-containing protein [Proteiniphilum sp.]MEA4916834.1 DUF4091 domain-containing protein [Proteiniphilum sp.]
MNVKKTIAALFILNGFLNVLSVQAQVSATLVDPLEKVFPETVIPIESFREIDVAKGEVASAQLILRSVQDRDQVKVTVEVENLPGAVISYGPIGYVRAERPYTDPAIDRITSITGFYPDPIMDNQPVDLLAGQAQTFFIGITIPLDAKAGTYTVTITVSTDNEIIRKSFIIHIHNVTLEKQRLWIANWYTLEPKRLTHLNNGEEVVLYSDLYWKLVKILAEKMADYGQNTAMISPLELAIYKKEGDRIAFDFSRFDRVVEIFRKAGVLGRIEGGHIGQRTGNWTSPFIVYVPDLESDSTLFLHLPIQDPRAQNFYSRFFKALVAHLKEKEWMSDYYQYLTDEPIEENKQSYIEIARYIKSIAPDIKIGEACHTKDLADIIDLWVPQVDFLNKDFDFYEERKKAGDEVWFYTCLAPKGNYANRFIDLPLIKTRIMHWINYKYQIDGYLHWGFNWWNDNPFVDTTDTNDAVGNFLPPGDAWIVYPGYRKLYSSIRLEAMRDGINDNTLLRMLEAKEPALAKKMADSIVYKFDWYDTSITHFRKIRKKILTALAED